VHAILEQWHGAGAPAGQLVAMAREQLDATSTHPLMRALWQPRLLDALEWIDRHVQELLAEGRRVVAVEQWGEMTLRGVTIKARADRIDRLADGTLAIVDYKTGQPPSGAMVEEGFALQLGVIGLIAAGGGVEGVQGTPNAFEYWSLARKTGAETYGYCDEPVLGGRKKRGVPREEFLDRARAFLIDALDRWIVGEEPFTARLNPNLPGYSDYDQLMRLDEWFTRGDAA